MKFEEKISGTAVTDFQIIPIFSGPIVWLSDAMKIIKHQETMDYLLDNYRFFKGHEEKENDWGAILNHDTILKLSILENYPEYKEELENYFGEGWLNHYIRFNH